MGYVIENNTEKEKLVDVKPKVNGNTITTTQNKKTKYGRRKTNNQRHF